MRSQKFFPPGQNYYDPIFCDAEAKMSTRLLAIAFALHAYRLQHGDYPAALTALTSSHILAALPEDPFAPNAQTMFRYRRVDSDHYVLYSVGPDGVDDGGRDFSKKSGDAVVRQDFRQALDIDSKGDWIVGIDSPRPMPQP